MLQTQIDTSSIVTVLASFCVILIGAVVFLKRENKELTQEHKSDLKLFDYEGKKERKELLDVLNKFYLNLEGNKLTDKDIRDKIERVIVLLENIKENSNG